MGQTNKPTTQLGLGQRPPGRALACCPRPVTLGLLDQQPGCCAEIQEHKRLHSGKGWGRECGQPSSMLTVTIGAFRAGRPAYHQRLCWHKGGILGSGARQSLGEVPATGTLGQQGPGFQAQFCHCRPVTATLLPHSGPQFPTCELALKAYLQDTFQLQGAKTRLSGVVKAHGQEAPTQPTRPQTLHLRLKPPFPYLQNGEGSFLPHRALRFK